MESGTKNGGENAIHYVRCLKCRKILKCSRFDTAVLLDHIRTDHPEIEIVGKGSEPKATSQRPSLRPSHRDTTVSDSFLSRNGGAPDIEMTHYSIKSEQLDSLPEIKQCTHDNNSETKVIYTRRYKINTPPATTLNTHSLRTPAKRNLYRTSIEKWRPANGSIYCPKCGCNKRPLIKTRTERFTYNTCGACCLLGCWPFCFLPCLFPGQNVEYLHCANCKTFLGLYDRDCNCIKPNREYVENKSNSQENDIDETSPAKQETHTYSKNSGGAEVETMPTTEDKQHLPSVVIDGKPVPPETLVKLQKLRKYSKIAGIDIDELGIDTETFPPECKESGRKKHN
uniref:LITAF domain-containing protein n=1 Tax=Glossina morsitans morsitans TaxID=37546 RepID=A0A1B0FQC6_GLOMM